MTWRAFLSKPRVFGLGAAFVLGPLVILLHEASHYAMARALGWRATLSFMSMLPGEGPQPHPLWVWAAGPAVEFLLCLGGGLWLARRRKDRPEAPLDRMDWLATLLGCFSLRWVIKPLLNATLPNGAGFGDEGDISQYLGLPPWTLLLALFPVACWILYTLVRLQPRRQRLVNLPSALGSMALGVYTWAYVLGPALFGRA